MRIAVLMDIGSPWSREVALLMAKSGQEVLVVDFAIAKNTTRYVGRSDVYQAQDIATFESAVAGIYLLETRSKGNLRYLLCRGQLRRILNEIKADILLTLYGGGNATLAWLSGFRPYVTWVVGSDILLAKGLQARLQAFAISRAALVPANGTHLAHQARLLAPRAKVQTLLHGLDLTKFPRAHKLDAEVVILSTRGFSPIYQNDLIVRAIAMLSASVVQQCRFVFAASGPELENVKVLAQCIMPESRMRRIEFVGGAGRARMHQLLNEAHIFVSMSRSDGTATSLLEAMASGLYPILSDIPANREWIEEGALNGRLACLEDPAELARQIEAAVAERDTWREVGERNRMTIEERADGKKNIGLLLRGLESICGTKGGSAGNVVLPY